MAEVGLFLLLVGGLHLLLPKATWYLSIGWKIAGAEASDAYLAVSRIGGGVAATIGLVLLMVAFVQVGQRQSSAFNGWQRFRHQMTSSKITSIHLENGVATATRAQIRVFAEDVRRVRSATLYANSPGGNVNSFAAQGSVLVRCRDGYSVSVIQIDNAGTFGIARGQAWLTPTYEFTSAPLNRWMSGL